MTPHLACQIEAGVCLVDGLALRAGEIYILTSVCPFKHLLSFCLYYSIGSVQYQMLIFHKFRYFLSMDKVNFTLATSRLFPITCFLPQTSIFLRYKNCEAFPALYMSAISRCFVRFLSYITGGVMESQEHTGMYRTEKTSQ